MRLIEALTLVFAIIALLSPFAAILLPALLQPLIAVEQSELSASNAWVQPLEVSLETSDMEGMSSNNSAGAAYMVIENRGGGADTLIGVATDAATSVEICEQQTDEASVVRLRLSPEGIDIPPNSTLTLEPSSHQLIIFSGVIGRLESGQEITLQLSFASGTVLDIIAIIADFPPES